MEWRSDICSLTVRGPDRGRFREAAADLGRNFRKVRSFYQRSRIAVVTGAHGKGLRATVALPRSCPT